jgi:lipoprotein-anchoring transpeptidase ErfK/SrfK
MASRSLEAKTDIEHRREPSTVAEGVPVGIRKIVMGLSAVIAVAGLAACSSGTTGSSASPQIAVAADTASQTSAPETSTLDTTTTAPSTTRTKTAPPATKKVTPKAPAVQVAAKKAPGVPCSAAARACVDLSARKAWLVRNGKVVFGPVSIMPGRVGWRTPTGTFHVQFKDANYFSHEFQVPMPDSVFFASGIAFHVGSLSVHSHGCVHLSQKSASTFFHTLSVGDEVQVLS